MKIDYLSISFYDRFSRFGVEMWTHGPASVLAGVVPAALMPTDVKDAKVVTQRPYPEGLLWSNGLSVLWGNSDTVLVRLSGRACAAIDCVVYLSSIQVKTEHLSLLNVSRLDVAHDIEDARPPSVIVDGWGVNPRIKTRNVATSGTGETVYIGSRTSDRFARVYRYNEPHPRAGVPRVEFQFGKRVANKIANEIRGGKTDVRSVFIHAYNKTFKTPYATSAIHDATVTSHSERSNAGTVVWFHKQVAPALSRLIREGEMTVADVVAAITDYEAL